MRIYRFTNRAMRSIFYFCKSKIFLFWVIRFRFFYSYFRKLIYKDAVSRYVLKDKVFNATVGHKVCIFSGFSMNQDIPVSTLPYLKALKALGFYIIYVSTSDIKAEIFDALSGEYLDRVIIRKNITRDFGSYHEGMLLVDLEKIEQLLLCNDSVYGPFYNLNPIFETKELKMADVWGLTDSYENSYHLQSYFLVFNLNARLRIFLQYWLRNFCFFKYKEMVIYAYEIGLSKALIKKDFKLAVKYPYLSILKKFKELEKSRPILDCTSLYDMLFKNYFYFIDLRFHKHLNSMHFFWFILLCHFDCPFIKKELVILNPEKVPGVEFWLLLLMNLGVKINLDVIKNDFNRRVLLLEKNSNK